MKYNELGKTGIKVSKIGLGVLTVGSTQLNLSVQKSGELIRYALSRGINFLDTAQYYETYPHIRAALAGTDLEPVIASKSLVPDRLSMKDAIEEARRELDRDRIDIFLLHEVRGGDDFNLRKGAWEALIEAKEKGIVRAIGVSTHHIDVAEDMVDVPECDVVFPLINRSGLGIRRSDLKRSSSEEANSSMSCTGDYPGRPEEMAEAIRKLSERGKGIFTMKAFGGGNLTTDYMACLDYVSSLPGVDSIMVGMGCYRDVDDAVAYCEGTLPPDYQPDVTQKRMRIESGDCIGCGTCVRRCPNHAISLGPGEYGDMAVIDHDVCITCGYCAPVCPVRALIMY